MLRALRLITKNKILRLGDSHWIQLKGTAIGTPPAPTYNKFFYGVFELLPIEIFGDNLLLHRQLLEDVMAIWIPWFYGTMKIHRTPWAMRPIISYTSSLMNPIGV